MQFSHKNIKRGGHETIIKFHLDSCLIEQLIRNQVTVYLKVPSIQQLSIRGKMKFPPVNNCKRSLSIEISFIIFIFNDAISATNTILNRNANIYVIFVVNYFIFIFFVTNKL